MRTKDLCWFAGMVYGSRGLLGVSIVGPGVDDVLQMVLEPTLAISRACVLGVLVYGAWRIWVQSGHMTCHMMTLDTQT
jgi:hypothetical protein